MNRISTPGRTVPAFLLAAACFVLAMTVVWAEWPEQQEGAFDAYWAISGSVHILERNGEVSAAAGRLTGTATVQTSQGAVPSFETDCVFFSKAGSGGMGRCVWTHTTGDEVFVDLSSEGPAGFGRARGVFTGGTGRFETIKGNFEFEWNYTLRGGADAELDGHTMQMRGRYRLR